MRDRCEHNATRAYLAVGGGWWLHAMMPARLARAVWAVDRRWWRVALLAIMACIQHMPFCAPYHLLLACEEKEIAVFGWGLREGKLSDAYWHGNVNWLW